MSLPRVLFLNRSYWPDSQATGQLLTELCEDLADTFDVVVLAGRPEQNRDRAAYSRSGTERRNGVTIRRVFSTRFPKTRLWGRVANLLSYLASASIAAWFLGRPAVIVVQTDPPLLCLLGLALKWWHGSKLVMYLQDLYPDVAVAVGKVREGRLTRALRTLVLRTYRSADRVLILSSDMRTLLSAQGVRSDQLQRMPNWADSGCVYPIKSDNPFRSQHGLTNQFVVMYSGNMGLTQSLDTLLLAAKRCQERRDISFVLVGDGGSRKRLEKLAVDLRLRNIRFLPFLKKRDLAASLSAADVHYVPLGARVSQCLMPSKFYRVLASGTAVLAAAPAESELAQITTSRDIGLSALPGDVESLVKQIEWASQHRAEIAAMGARARQLLLQEYDRPIATDRFKSLIDELCNGRRATPEPKYSRRQLEAS